ncbi:MAG: hypothetical protein OEZ03_09745 [Alphaproteobacteria bacterium]|nr:hypothetical protein [Alphaproteobacteria bacterium]
MTHELFKQGADATAGTAVVATWLEWLPDSLSIIAAFLSIVWFLIRIWESETVKGLRGIPPKE